MKLKKPQQMKIEFRNLIQTICIEIKGV
jgi:hypothetical protein